MRGNFVYTIDRKPALKNHASPTGRGLGLPWSSPPNRLAWKSSSVVFLFQSRGASCICDTGRSHPFFRKVRGHRNLSGAFVCSGPAAIWDRQIGLRNRRAVAEQSDQFGTESISSCCGKSVELEKGCHDRRTSLPSYGEQRVAL